MFNKNREINHKWFTFGKSFINFYYVTRVYSDATRPILTIEFNPQGKSEYTFDSVEERDEYLKIMYEYLTK
jgi:hypothetical protein